MVNRCFLSPLEKELFRAEQGQFCMDIGENENTPVKGIQDKLIHYWEEYPEMLRKMFQRAFMDGGTLCELRPTEVDWKAGAGAADDGLSGLRLRFPRVFEPPAAAGKRYAPLSGLREDMVRAYRRDEYGSFWRKA